MTSLRRYETRSPTFKSTVLPSSSASSSAKQKSFFKYRAVLTVTKRNVFRVTGMRQTRWSRKLQHCISLEILVHIFDVARRFTNAQDGFVPTARRGPSGLLCKAYRVPLSGVKRPGSGVQHPPHLAPRLSAGTNKTLLHTTLCLQWHVTGWHLHLLSFRTTNQGSVPYFKRILHSSCPSACNNASPTGQISLKFGTGAVYKNLWRNYKFGQNHRH
jgi:hypothetical protein